MVGGVSVLRRVSSVLCMWLALVVLSGLVLLASLKQLLVCLLKAVTWVLRIRMLDLCKVVVMRVSSLGWLV